VNRTSGHVTVEKLSLVVDADTVIHPNSAKAQVEGAALWGLSINLLLFEISKFQMIVTTLISSPQIAMTRDKSQLLPTEGVTSPYLAGERV
jgi:hypothetical protein